jgi:hypothetical protein
MPKSKLSITLTRVCLDLFEIFLSLANFVEAIGFRDYFAILLLSSSINSNDVDLFEGDLEDRIGEKSSSSFEAKALIA